MTHARLPAAPLRRVLLRLRDSESLTWDELADRAGITLGVGFGILRTANAEPVESGAEIAGNVAFAVVFAVPALLALLGLRRGPSLLVAAGTLDLVLAFLTLTSFIGLIFVPPAVMFFVAVGRMRGADVSATRSIATVLVALLGGTLAFLALFAREDPVCWASNLATGESFHLDASRLVHGSSISMNTRDLPSGATESGCTSATISTHKAVAATAIVATMLGTAWVLSKPSELRPTSAPTTG